MTTNDVYTELYEILKNKGKKKMIIGIMGFVGSGKTHFAKGFADFLKGKNINSTPFNTDLYNASTREERNLVIESLKENHDPNWPRRAYPQDVELIKSHLKNIKEEKNFSCNNLCDPMTKELNFPLEFSFDEDSTSIEFGDEKNTYDKNDLWVLYEGVKLVKYKDHLDHLIFLRADPETRFDRLLERNKKLTSPAKIRRDLFDDLEENLILDHELKEEHADIVIDHDSHDIRIVKK